MANAPVSTPLASNSTPSNEVTPEFKRVQMSCDHDDAFACIAMIIGKTLDEVRQTAIEKFKHPKHGPYWVLEKLIIQLLAHYGWVASAYKESKGIASLPDLALAACRA